jgi:hypothetical protein
MSEGFLHLDLIFFSIDWKAQYLGWKYREKSCSMVAVREILHIRCRVDSDTRRV